MYSAHANDFFQLTKESDFFLSHIFSINPNLSQISKVTHNCKAGNRKERDKIGLRKNKQRNAHIFSNKEIFWTEYVCV